ncbi:ComF family protein [Streptomyces sp. R11]|uniref:ComF family protein n=1 Tax=Streptomyces sp. R11 TaxID=3238625 RepID=A0AB39N1Z1_9ACTN
MAALWTDGLLTKTSASKAGERRRQITSGAFDASEAVRGKRVLLLDDTFTSGGTIASAAHALKMAGANQVIGLAFGRQLRAEWDDNRDLISELPNRSLDLSECVVHNSASSWMSF